MKIAMTFIISLMSFGVLAQIELGRTYSCTATYEDYAIVDGKKIQEDPAETTEEELTFEVEDTHVFLSNDGTRIGALPNYNACERAFEVKKIILNLHAIISGGITSSLCSKDELYASYYVGAPFGGSSQKIEAQATDEGMDVHKTSITFGHRQDYEVWTSTYICKVK